VRLQVATQVLGGAPGGKKSCRYVGLIMMPCGFGTHGTHCFLKISIISSYEHHEHQYLSAVIIGYH